MKLICNLISTLLFLIYLCLGNKSRKVNSLKSRTSTSSFGLLAALPSRNSPKVKLKSLAINEGSSVTANNQTEEEVNHTELYIRRHTIPDMTVAAYGMVICGTDDIHRRYRGRIEK